MTKEYTAKKVLKRLVAFTLCTTVAVTTIFFGVPLSVKATEEDNPEYIIGVADDRNWMASVVDGQSSAISSEGVLLWPGEKVVSSSREFVEDNTSVGCHHDGSVPDPHKYSKYVGFTISSADEEVTLATLGDLVSDEAEMIIGGTMNSTTGQTDDKTTDKMAYHKSFTAKELVFVEYDKTTDTTHFTQCDCASHTAWDVYQYYLYSFKVHKISTSDVNIDYADTATWNSTNVPTAFKVSKDNATYSYEIPTKVGYVFDGWEFKDKNENDLSSIIEDSKDGTITFAGINANNWKTIDDISRNGITATPKWTQKKITINFDPNGGVYSRVNYSEKSVCIVTEDNFIYEYSKNETSYFSSERITREGYNFDGWYIDDTKITCLADIPVAKSNSSQIYNVKAKWTDGDNPPTYTIDSTTGTLTITSQTGFPSLEYGKYAKRVVVNEGITEIPEGAFEDFEMEEIELPTTIKTIGSNAFSYCTGLQSITIPDGVTEIKEECFYKCSMLEEVVLPSQLKSIGEDAFYETSITSITIPDSVTEIGSYAFAKTGLQSVEIPGNVTLGYNSVFYACKQLESVTLKYGITSIPNDTFSCCTALKKLTLPNTIESIGWGAFQDVNKEEVIFDGTEQQWEALCEQAEELRGATVTYVGQAAPHVHDAKLVPEVAASCIATGVKAYYTCDCGKYFEDKDCTTIISNLAAWKTGAGLLAKREHTLMKTDAKAATCTTAGNSEYYTCSSCGKYFSDAAGTTEIAANSWVIAALGHDNHSKVVPATTSEDGYTADVCSRCGAESNKVTISAIKSVTLKSTSATYTGKAIKPAVTVKDKAGNKISAEYYTVSYKNNKTVGKATVTITFKGNYSGTLKKNFNIVPKATKISKVAAAKKGFKVTWKKQTTQTTGYEIQYSTDKNFKKAVNTVTISKNKTTSKSITKLAAKKKYYVRIRTYKLVGKTKYYSDWSKISNVTTKK